jgi:predicted metal-dependent HD superfamily phosphohydrolase
VNWPGIDRWQRLWQSIGANGEASGWHEALTRAHVEPQRHYHNQQHIADCLTEFDGVRHLAKQPEAVELAIWFHDAVYDPKAPDNEEQSAALARGCLEAAVLPDLARTVAELVLATKTHDTVAGSDAAVLVDVDLSILGQSEARFAGYESQIRAEYAWVAQEVFNAKRTEILQRFLARHRIFSTDHFFTRYEAQARQNLAQSIRTLSRSATVQITHVF